MQGTAETVHRRTDNGQWTVDNGDGDGKGGRHKEQHRQRFEQHGNTAPSPCSKRLLVPNVITAFAVMGQILTTVTSATAALVNGTQGREQHKKCFGQHGNTAPSPCSKAPEAYSTQADGQTDGSAITAHKQV
jgi:hypothetical protein